MGTKKRIRSCWSLALMVSFLLVAEAVWIGPSQLQDASGIPTAGLEHSCGRRDCLDVHERSKRDDPTDPPAEDPTKTGGEAVTEAPSGAEAAGGAAGAAAGNKTVAAGNDTAAAGTDTAAGLSGQDLPLPPPMQKMPDLPEGFPFPDVAVVQEAPLPTKPRKKPGFIGGFPGSGPVFPATEPILEIIPETIPEVVPDYGLPSVSNEIQIEPLPEPMKPLPAMGGSEGSINGGEGGEGNNSVDPVNPAMGGNVGAAIRPQDWRFSATPRLHQKCTTKKKCKAPASIPYPDKSDVPIPVETGDDAWDQAVEKSEDTSPTATPSLEMTTASAGRAIGTAVFIGVAYLLQMAL